MINAKRCSMNMPVLLMNIVYGTSCLHWPAMFGLHSWEHGISAKTIKSFLKSERWFTHLNKNTNSLDSSLVLFDWHIHGHKCSSWQRNVSDIIRGNIILSLNFCFPIITLFKSSEYILQWCDKGINFPFKETHMDYFYKKKRKIKSKWRHRDNST